MNTSAIVLMITTQLIVTLITASLFRKVLKTPQRNEPDSFTDNDPE